LTQEDVANRVGVSTQFYGRIERGYALPSVTTLRRMLDVLDLRADDLLGVPGVGATGMDEAAEQAQIESENPPLRRLMRYLRRASPVTLQAVQGVLDEIEKAEAILRQQRASRRGRRAGSGGEDEAAGRDAGAASEAGGEPDEDSGQSDED
jgi:transcriptional regulator with XRE-family HTH domain